jgi:hypothetical protein
MLAGKVCGLAMNGGFQQKIALALAESRTVGSVLQTIVRGMAKHCGFYFVGFHAIVKSGPNSKI